MSRVFNDKITPFEWSDLHGKTLTIQVVKGPEGEVVAGKDECGKIYILNIKVVKER